MTNFKTTLTLMGPIVTVKTDHDDKSETSAFDMRRVDLLSYGSYPEGVAVSMLVNGEQSRFAVNTPDEAKGLMGLWMEYHQ